jgi:hypothetical protein
VLTCWAPGRRRACCRAAPSPPPSLGRLQVVRRADGTGTSQTFSAGSRDSLPTSGSALGAPLVQRWMQVPTLAGVQPVPQVPSCDTTHRQSPRQTPGGIYCLKACFPGSAPASPDPGVTSRFAGLSYSCTRPSCSTAQDHEKDQNAHLNSAPQADTAVPAQHAQARDGLGHRAEGRASC